MFIFRVEHKREFCDDDRYMIGGSSLTGHGTFRKCRGFDYNTRTPNFGLTGEPPHTQMMEHERCAVTVDQWKAWLGPDGVCRKETVSCYDENAWCRCSVQYVLNLGEQWHIMCYWVEDNASGIDWRWDNGQIVFNPAFAVNMGSVVESEVFELSEIAA